MDVRAHVIEVATPGNERSRFLNAITARLNLIALKAYSSGRRVEIDSVPTLTGAVELGLNSIPTASGKKETDADIIVVIDRGNKAFDKEKLGSLVERVGNNTLLWIVRDTFKAEDHATFAEMQRVNKQVHVSTFDALLTRFDEVVGRFVAKVATSLEN